MKTFKTLINRPPSYPIDHASVFFDIETTGLSAHSSIVFLIGVLYQEENNWYMIQWMNDDVSSEKQTIECFFHFIKTFKTLVHYNGTGFDLPYLKKRSLALEIDYIPDQLISLDLYKRLKAYKKLFDFKNMKQKTIEESLLYHRGEDIGGKDLIKEYFLYAKLKDTKRENRLLLHNHHDLLGMLTISSILGYTDLFNGNFSYSTETRVDRLTITLHLKQDIPLPVSLKSPELMMECKERTGTLEVFFYQGELKFFYPDYKNYYYLPLEDTAIHKSVAAYVDSEFKEKAKPATCYTKKQSVFLPQYEEVYTPVFLDNYRDKISYFEWSDSIIEDEKQFKNYLLSLICLTYQNLS